MSYKEEQKRAQKLAGEGKTAKEIVNLLEKESKVFKTLSDPTKLRDVHRWIETKKEDSSTNWIEVHKSKHGELPLIPEYMLPVVKDKTAKRVSKDMELSTPNVGWWNELLPTNQEQVLQTVDWLCKHNKDWWCKSREDYQEMIKRLIPGKPGSAPIIEWRR